MRRVARLFTWLQHLAGISKQPYLDEGAENVSRVVTPAPAGSRLSEPPLDMTQRERSSLYVSSSPAPPVGDMTLEHGYGIALELGPVVAVREKRDALHGSPGNASPPNALVRRLSCTGLTAPERGTRAASDDYPT